jgi:hypothetical protein
MVANAWREYGKPYTAANGQKFYYDELEVELIKD